MKHLLKPTVLALLWPGDTRSEENPRVFAWGNNTSGQLGLGSEISKAFPCEVEEFNREKIQGIFASPHASSSSAIDNLGSVYTWGNGLDNILGHNSGDSNIIIPTKLSLEDSFTSISIGGGHMVGLTNTGKIISWGLDDCGQCGHELIKQVVDPRAFRPQVLTGKSPDPVKGELENKRVISVSCGKFFTAAVTEAGELYTWGSGREYSLGHGDRNNQKLPKKVENLKNQKIVKVSCGRNFVVALDSEGNVYTWGLNDYGQLGHGQIERFKSEPQKVRLIKDVVDIACGDFHVLALTKNGEVFSWGNGGDGQLGHGNTSNQSTPNLIHMEKVSKISGGGGHSAFITQDFKLFMCGRGTDGQLGRQGKIESIASNRNVPVIVDHFNNYKVLQVTAGTHHSLAMVIKR